MDTNWRMAAGGAGGRELEGHSGVAEEDPGAADVVIGDAGFGVEDGGAERRGRIALENLEQGLVHGGLRRLIGETGGSPDCGGAAVGSEEKSVGERSGVDILEETVEAIHQEIDGELIAIGEIGGGSVVEKIGERPLLFGAVAGIIDEERAGVERGENLLGNDAGILAIGKNFDGLERRRQIRGRKFRGRGEIGADILVGD